MAKKFLVGMLICLLAGFFPACRLKHETYVKLLSYHLDDAIITLGRGVYAGGYIAEESDRPGRKIFLTIEYPGFCIGDKLGVKIERLEGSSMHSPKVDATKFEMVDGKRVFRKLSDVPVYKVLELQTAETGKEEGIRRN